MSDKIVVPCKLPQRENSRVYKEECIFCFHTPEHQDGLFVSLLTHYGYCPDHLKLVTANGGGYLHFQRTRKRSKKSGGEPDQKITKLAIGVQGGLQETQYDFEEKYELVVFPGPTKYQLTDPRISEDVRSCCDTLVVCESANRLHELESLANTWDGSFVVATKHLDLPQLTPAPKIPPKGWRCQADGCDKTDNLWLNLTDGKIFCGRKFFDGTGGNNHAIDHYRETGYPLAVKLGTITAHQADVYSYDEDEMVLDPNLEEHLAHFGINMKAMEKTEKTMLELELDLNQKFEFSRIQESGRDLKPVYGPGFTGLVNLGSSCYMNSALQTLTLVPEVQRVFSGESADRIFRSFLPPANANDLPNPGENLKLQFAKLFSGILSGKFSQKPPEHMEGGDIVPPDSSVKPFYFRTLVGKGHSEFGSRRQQDVEEYLRWVFEKLEQQADIGGDAVVDAFRFEVVERLLCQATGRTASDRRPETILSLPIPMDKAVNLAEVRAYEEKMKTEKAAGKKLEDVVFAKVPLEACLEEFAAPSYIEGARSPFDDSIKSTLAKTQRLGSFPDYLLIQLKKFTVADDWTPKKLEVEIVMPDQLNIENLAPHGDHKDEPMDTKPPPARPKTPEPTPEEVAGVTQLVDAGFPLDACKKAWRRSGGRLDGAFEWLLAHSGDPDFDQPDVNPTPAVGGQGQQANEEEISGLTNMGFTRDQARKALRLNGGNFENAIAWLLDNPADPGEPEAAAVGQRRTSVGAAKKYRNGPGKYHLIGFISHMGSSTHSGHYVCHLLKEIEGKQRWVIYNDEKVAMSEDPPKGLGYVYLYERLTGK